MLSHSGWIASASVTEVVRPSLPQGMGMMHYARGQGGGQTVGCLAEPKDYYRCDTTWKCLIGIVRSSGTYHGLCLMLRDSLSPISLKELEVELASAESLKGS